jgi:hypothetical protein
MRVFLAGGYKPELMLRQTPQGRGLWRDIQFCTGDAAELADWLVVVDQPQPLIVTSIPKERRILAVSEPPGCRDYPPSFLESYGTVISPEMLKGYRGRHLQRQPGLPWWLGVGNYFGSNPANAPLFEEIASLPLPQKPRLLSVVCSTHNLIPMHRKRIAFVEKLKAYFGDTLHWYGRGVRPMEDKSEAILPYRYQIVLENNKIDHFWTEKIADCYLGYTFPIYSGCTNLGDYFDRRSFEPAGIDDVQGAITTIKSVIESDRWEKSLDAIMKARERVLFQYNFFNSCAEIVRELETVLPPVRYLASPEILYPVAVPLRQKVKDWERRNRRRLRAVLEQRGLISKKHKQKRKTIATTAVPTGTRADFERI